MRSLLVVNHKNTQLCLRPQSLPLHLIFHVLKLLVDIPLQLFHQVHQRRTGIVNFVDNKNPSTEETAVGKVVAESGKVEPLGAYNFSADFLFNLKIGNKGVSEVVWERGNCRRRKLRDRTDNGEVANKFLRSIFPLLTGL